MTTFRRMMERSTADQSAFFLANRAAGVPKFTNLWNSKSWACSASKHWLDRCGPSNGPLGTQFAPPTSGSI
jgi:hypothetical protein